MITSATFDNKHKILTVIKDNKEIVVSCRVFSKTLETIKREISESGITIVEIGN